MSSKLAFIMKFELQELDILIIPSNMIPVTMDQSFTFTDSNGNITEILKINFFQLSEKNKKIEIALLDQNIFIPPFRKIDSEIGNCVTLSESIFQNLKIYLKNYFEVKNFDLKHGGEPIDFQKIDFMTSRNILSDRILKKDINVLKIAKLNSRAKIKYFTKLFYDFILRRNMITHGKMFFNSNAKKYMLEYIDPQSNQKLLCFIDDSFFSNFKNCYQLLEIYLQDLRMLHGR